MVHLKNNISYYLIIIHCLLLHCRYVNTDTIPQCDIMMTKYEDMLLIFIKMYGQDWPGNWAVAAPGVRIWGTADCRHQSPLTRRSWTSRYIHPIEWFVISDCSGHCQDTAICHCSWVCKHFQTNLCQWGEYISE